MDKRVNGQSVAVLCVALCVALWGVVSAHGVAVSVQSGFWTNAATWGGAVPVANEDVTVAADHVVTVDQSPVALGDVTVAGTLSFSGWETVVTAAVVTVGGTVTHAIQSAVEADEEGEWHEDAAIRLVCGSLTVTPDGAINANGNGFAGGAVNNNGKGPGGSIYKSGRSAGGAGHGGRGGGPNGAAAYGAAAAPTRAGSGGAGINGVGGAGGGAVFIKASDLVTVDGVISANGGTGAQGYSGEPGTGGSGGSIAITCASITGQGAILAEGGDSGLQIVSSIYYRNGGGGGGRIAIVYDVEAQRARNPELMLSAAEGRGRDDYFGEPGTVWLTDTALLGSNMRGGRYLTSATWSEWELPELTIGKGMLVLPDGLGLHVTGDITIADLGALQLANGVVEVGGTWRTTSTQPLADSRSTTTVYADKKGSFKIYGDMILDRCQLVFYGAATNTVEMVVEGSLLLTNNVQFTVSGEKTAATNINSVTIKIGDEFRLSDNSWVYLVSHPTNGTSHLIQACDVTISANSGINADGRGFAGATAAYPLRLSGWGPGGGVNGPASGTSIAAGGGYGGYGGSNNVVAGGAVYGKARTPLMPGSGGGRSSNVAGGNGGGLINIVATETVVLDGSLLANGLSGRSSAGCPSGGGAGGGVMLRCASLQGSGVVKANGGDAGWQVAVLDRAGGSGGGGRIAIHAGNVSRFEGEVSVNHGGVDTGFTGDFDTIRGDVGTIYWNPALGSVIMVR